MSRSIPKKFALLITFCLVIWLPLPAEAAQNVIVNGDFSDGLAGWTCIEDSTQCGYCPEAWSECSVDDGQAVIHGYSAYGRGVLRQEFAEISPAFFTFWWDLDGDCGPLWVDLVSGENVVLRFRTKHDALVSANTWTDVNLAGVTERIEEPPNYLDHGNCQVVFDYTNLEATFTVDAKEQGLRTCTLPLPPDFSVNAIALTIENNCCDGRNDTYGYFDDVVVVPEPPCGFSDDFEDEVIDTSLWSWGGERRAWNPTAVPKGDWSYSHEEIDGPDGYLQMRLWGPPSGMSFGAEAWVRTLYNFNDGKEHIIDFTWKAEVFDNHHNVYFIQITDGYIPPASYNYIHWPYAISPYPPERDGTADLLWTQDPDSHVWQRGGFLGPNPYIPVGNPETWSITIDPSGTANLYNGPNGTGLLLRTEALDIGKAWYVRFMVLDGTSAGFPAGEARFNLYDFSAICEPPAISVALDIKPQSCPNPLNVTSKGVLPVAILGTEDFDVNQIDIASIRLEGVAPIRSNYEDVATPVSDGNQCECTTEGPDGYTDLTLKFKTQEIVNALGGVLDGEVLELILTGELLDQTPIEGTDCIRVIKKGKKGH